jgi:hypothetical protein
MRVNNARREVKWLTPTTLVSLLFKENFSWQNPTILEAKAAQTLPVSRARKNVSVYVPNARPRAIVASKFHLTRISIIRNRQRPASFPLIRMRPTWTIAKLNQRSPVLSDVGRT